MIKTLADIPGFYAQSCPDAVAMEFAGATTTYAELAQRSARTANALIAMGVEPARRVAILDKNSDIYCEALFGIARAGAVTVGVNYRLAPAEVEFIVNDAEVRVFLVGQEFYPLVEQIEDKLSGIEIIALQGEHPRWQSYAEWRDAASAESPKVAVSASDDALQLYTSGTTGLPKGVQSQHSSVVGFIKASIAEGWAAYVPGTDKTLVAMPFYHVAGVMSGLFMLYQGGYCLIHGEVDPNAILKAIPENKITNAILVPAVIQMLVQHPEFEQTDFSSMRVLIYGASPIPEPVLLRAREFIKCDFIHVYGMTENQGGGTYLPAAAHDPALGKHRSVGKPYAGTEMRIVNASGEDVAQGEVGEVLLRESWIMRGYWNRPEATVETLQDGWLHTGDAGYLDEDGYLYIHDRVKEMIISGAENIYPAEVENALHKHENILDAAVVGIPDEQWGEAVLAFVVAKDKDAFDEGEMVDFLRKHIAGYKIPRRYELADELPRNASGKLLRRVLRAPYWEGRDREVN